MLPLSRKVYYTLSRIYDFDDDEKIDRGMSHNLYFCFHSLSRVYKSEKENCGHKFKITIREKVHLTSSHAYKLLQILLDMQIICTIKYEYKKLFCQFCARKEP